MAIAYVTSNVATSGASYVGSVSLNVTVSGASPFVVVGIRANSGGAGLPSISAITCGGDAMTAVSNIAWGSGQGNFWLYYKADVGTGEKTIAITYGANYQSSVAVGVYSGVDKNNPINASGTDASTGDSTLTSTVNNCWHIMAAGDAAGNNISAGANTTLRTAANTTGILDKNAVVSPAGSNTINSGNDFAIGIMAKPAIIFELTESLTITEQAFSFIKKMTRSLTEAVDVLEVNIINLTETITTSDSYLRVKKAWENIAKNISSWSNTGKT